MSNLRFSLRDYKKHLQLGLFSPPEELCPYYEVDPVLYKDREKRAAATKSSNIDYAINELRKRIHRNYFHNVYPLQAKTLDYSNRSFPAYRFILPHVMAADWLAMVGWNKFQRDHLLHQPLCGYIVLKLLNRYGRKKSLVLSDEKTLLEVCVDNILRWEGTAYIRDFLINCGVRRDNILIEPKSPNDKKIAQMVWGSIFREAAYVAAVFHDLGYPLQYVENVQADFEKNDSSIKRQNRSPEQIINAFGHRMLFYCLNGYCRVDVSRPSTWNKKLLELVDNALTTTHGFPGGIHFLELNDCIRRYPNAAQNPFRLLCVEWAAAAIMMHDMAKLYWGKGIHNHNIPENPFLRLSFDKDPLSAVITLADFMQEFERPFVNHVSNNKYVHIQYNSSSDRTEIRINKTNLVIKFYMKNAAMCAMKQKDILKDEFKYFDSNYGYIDMSSIGITNVKLEVCA